MARGTQNERRRRSGRARAAFAGIAALVLTDATTLAARTVTDMRGHQVSIPDHPARIADLWYAHNELVVMLGGAARIAATVDTPSRQPWMFRFAPDLKKAVALDNPMPNTETLLGAGVDLAFYPSSEAVRTALTQANIPALAMDFQDFDGLAHAVTLTADVLDTPLAQQRATLYTTTLNERIRSLRARTGALTESQRPRVLHLLSLHPLKVDGRGTIIDQWITLAGGRNAADITGVQKPVTIEQIVAWNPEVIIIGSAAGPFDPNADGGLWRSVAAVRSGRVVPNPAGVFPWDRYGSESLLQLSWAAALLHPDMFRASDIPGLVRAFYRTYFDVTLSEDDLHRILIGAPPSAADTP
ncbi:Fe3+ transporter ferrichrome-binding periplasmic protein [Ameyamaea chiangmaiensis NBRC 103196]|uniref:ABC transporter substrate-binding protein n=1 Tax=Ameyamaea chiangmaiensis TaxID=442969 RepID=A0A850P776_9PROT|nr:ABC transporter substrate-binding protein [Ameyamaea chiangmaiensis]MBS4075960.1 ABC transporter substrate-binding protein [Ameyamaea chiangmaiensis]NVN39754.1 ABC transporter substrate-binding protein [Ameyamaea chiangmaiensis]GBQ61610.1 Fe3+ transporter ferrichrome-binding periplasmic protein [Ameyamaea chiangmaiensis NBRC 103196]